MRYLLVGSVFAVLSLPAAAATDVKAVAPFVDDQTIAVVHVDLGRIDADALFQRLGKIERADPKFLAVIEEEVGSRLNTLTGAGARGIFIVFSLANLPEEPPFVVIPLGQGKDSKALAKTLAEDKALGKFRFEARDGVVVGAGENTLRRLRNFKPEPRPELAKAFAAAEGVVQLACIPGSILRRAVVEALPKLPKELGGGATADVARGLLWLGAGIDVPPGTALRLTVQSADAASAKALEGVVVKALALLGQHKESREALPDFDRLVRAFTPRADGDRLTLVVKEANLVGLLAPLLQRVRQTAIETKDTNKLKQIGIALFNYHDTYNHFPAAASTDKKGRRLLSWRVHILPYIEQVNLYKEFHLDEPWDSAHNKKLIARMPAVFAPANAKLAAQGKTTYLAPIGQDTVFPGTRPVKITEITDGTSNTILIVEASDDRAVPWTRPDDLPIDPANPAKGLHNRAGKGFLTLFADSSVHFLPANIDKKMLAALFTRNGGEVVNLP